MDLLRLEFDIQHIAVVSRKVPEEHALIRLILSALATAEELQNLVKRDLRLVKREGLNYYSVRLTSGRKSRVSPIDAKTYNILSEMTKGKSGRERIFDYSTEEMDRIVEKYSPSSRKYNVDKLRRAVIEILKDCMLFGDEGYIEDLMEGINIEKVTDFFYDFHPMYAGMWDIDDDEVAEDFIATYSKLMGIDNPREIAVEIGEEVDRVKRLMRK